MLSSYIFWAPVYTIRNIVSIFLHQSVSHRSNVNILGSLCILSTFPLRCCTGRPREDDDDDDHRARGWAVWTGLLVSEPKTEIMCMLVIATGMKECSFAVNAAGMVLNQKREFVYLGGRSGRT